MESHFTLKQLTYFLATAQHGSLTAASEAVHLSQSAMSNAISELERNLGVQLVVRQASRGLFLTTAGELLVSKAARLLEDADEIASQVTSTHLTLSGPLRIGCYPSLVSTLMPTLLSEFMERYPEVQLELQEGTEHELISHLRTGACDILLTYGVRMPGDVEMRQLAELQSYILLSRGHPLAGRKKVQLSDLETTPLIMLDLPPSGGYFTEILVSAGSHQTPRFRTSSVDVVRSLVARNFGYSILTQPRLANPVSDDSEDFKMYPIDLPIAWAPIVLAKLKVSTTTRRAQAFIELCDELVPGLVGRAPRKR
ncbi:MAG TPA: LysR family transcriptional regulator [Pseudolysinimonas sp.]|nr:LysR family transcriptional regulator [Pseudolysinimonas sp.]